MAVAKGPGVVSVLTLTFAAGGDLSSDQFKAVKLSADRKVILCTGVTDKPIGILQNKPDAAEKAAEVMLLGVTKVNSDIALSAGNLISTQSDGQLQIVTPGSETTEYIIGQVLFASGAAGERAEAAVNCINIARAA